MIKLLALDLDGTTLNSKGEVPDEHRRAIRAAEKTGVLVTIATGRRFRDAQPVGLDLELNGPLITHNGALLKYAKSEETVACALLSTETSLEIVRVGKEFGGDALVSTDPRGHGTLLYDRVSEYNLPLKKYLRWSETVLGGQSGRDGVEHVPALEDVLAEYEVVHISFSGTCDAMSTMMSVLNRELGNTVTILPIIYPHRDVTFIDLLPPGASKGHGVAKLAELNGFAPENVMAIGDNFNDLEMLKIAGTPVVMGNADERLRAHAGFYTTLTNDEGGVAAAIERFILNKENN
ncbi:MAG TPA: Cof-type HAD-IIB family hydrolase [Pyrinomonadaceae bacterium]|jgi:Cof subfamily protein (haloacid dehalogenase superfamily)|nr:Cof-type HAD-IIB family hydrolase [Pyrinomonadaceae bacterium]